MKKILSIICIVALLVLGAMTVVGVSEEEASISTLAEIDASYTSMSMGYCPWCVPMNGHGACNSRGICI